MPTIRVLCVLCWICAWQQRQYQSLLIWFDCRLWWRILLLEFTEIRLPQRLGTGDHFLPLCNANVDKQRTIQKKQQRGQRRRRGRRGGRRRIRVQPDSWICQRSASWCNPGCLGEGRALKLGRGGDFKDTLVTEKNWLILDLMLNRINFCVGDNIHFHIKKGTIIRKPTLETFYWSKYSKELLAIDWMTPFTVFTDIFFWQSPRNFLIFCASSSGWCTLRREQQRIYS